MATNTARAYTPAGVVAAATGVFGWGIGVIVIKLTDSPFLIVSFYRHLFSVPILLVAWAFTSDKRLPWRAAGIGGVLFALHQMANISALRYSTAAVVTVLFALQPILVGLASGRLVGERTTRAFYLWSIVAIAGCAIVVVASSGQHEATTLGTILAVLNLVLWSAYYLATKRARADVGTIAWLLVMTTVSGVIVGAVALIVHQSFAVESAHEMGLLVFLAVGPATMGHLLVTWAHPRIHVAASSAMQLGVPIVASIGAAVVLHERFGPWHVLGVLVALCGTTVAMRSLPPPVVEESVERFGEVAT